MIWGSGYLGWRLAVSWRGANPVAFGLLCAVELYNFISLGFLAFFGWRWSPPQRPVASPGYRVDVFVTTYNETREVVEATLAGCAALRYPHRTYLLDDGRRREMSRLAEQWGAVWITRPDNAHAKAGNINHALGRTDGDLVFCLDADHVPLPDALDALVGYFDDPRVALVQSPHDFYNQDSVQHYETGRHEQSLFFEVVCPGKDRHNGAFWCGSAALLRREALMEAGGVSTETIAEDFHSTIKLHRSGWTTHYHDEVLVQGLAPLDLDGYLLQRDRWARGNLAVFRLPESPLSRRAGLGLRQRISYFASLYAYAAGAARLLLIGLLLATLVGGVLPARMSVLSLGIAWAPWTLLAILSSDALCRGYLRASESSHYTLVTAAIFTRALRCALVPSRTKFKVTPKAGVDAGGLRALSRLRLVTGLGAALAAALLWRGAGLVGLVGEPRLPVWAVVFAMGLGAWECYRIATALHTVVRHRQRREQVRFSCLVPATIEGAGNARQYGRVVDVSVSGIGLLAPDEPSSGTQLRLSFALPGLDGTALPVAVEATVRSARPDPSGGWRLGLSIAEVDELSRANLVRYCYVVHPCERLRCTPARPLAEVAAVRSGVSGKLDGDVGGLDGGDHHDPGGELELISGFSAQQ